MRREPRSFVPGQKVRVTIEVDLAQHYKEGESGLYYWSTNGSRFLYLGLHGRVRAVKPRVRRHRGRA